jgi:opacity protein-like surface antigen
MQFKLTLAIIASFLAAPVVAADRPLPEQATPARGVYVGVFGGGGFGTNTDVNQLGTAFFTEAEGGPLAVNATGRTNSGGVGFVGGQVGYELSYGSFVQPAFEIEGFYLRSGTRRATVDSPTDRLDEHTFDNTFSIHNSVFLANMVLSFPTLHPGLTPYIGGGIGGARVSVDGANSLQTNPMEAGINHFNSNPDSSVWTFAAQAKARSSCRPWAQCLRVRRVSLSVRRLQRSDFRADRVSHPCSHHGLDGSLRRYVLPSGNRWHRV